MTLLCPRAALSQPPCPPVLCLDGCPQETPAPACVVPEPLEFEGFGAITSGGAGGEICLVSTLADGGPGSLRACLTDRTIQGATYIPRTINFNVGGVITLQSDIRIITPFITVDGSTAPAPGITIRKINPEDGEVRVTTGSSSAGHDLIFTHLRFDGGWDGSTDISNVSSTLNLDGEDAPDGVYRIVLDHMTFVRATDSSPDMWGEVNDITIQRSLFFDNFHPMTISHSGGSQARHRISLHHNLFARNHERNPQIRGNVRDFEYVNNIVFNWTRMAGGYGIRIREVGGTYPTDLNFINNFFLSDTRPEWALVYGDSPGGAPYPGAIHVSGNVLPPENTDSYSTRATPVSIPNEARISTVPTSTLVDEVLPDVGTHYKTPEEDALLQQVDIAMRQN
jgi:pectate lyase